MTENRRVRATLILSVLTLLIATFVSSPAARANSLTTILYEGFEYTAGSGLTGLNGGSGWSAAWAFPYSTAPEQPLTSQSTSLSYPGLTPNGGKAGWGTAGRFGPNGSGRTLPLQETGVIYFQFLSDFDSRQGGTPMIRLISWDGATETRTGGFGNNGRTNMALLGPDLNPISGGETTIPMDASQAPLGATANLVVARIDYERRTTDMWVNPNLGTFDYFSPPAATVSATGFAPQFNRMDIYVSNPGVIDEITIFQLNESLTGGASTPFVTDESIELVANDYVRCQVSEVSARSGEWVTLPASGDCQVAGEPNARVLGWATIADFPIDIAKRQVTNGWGAYELFDAEGRMTGVFIPAGGSTLLSGSTQLYPVVG